VSGDCVRAAASYKQSPALGFARATSTHASSHVRKGVHLLVLQALRASGHGMLSCAVCFDAPRVCWRHAATHSGAPLLPRCPRCACLPSLHHTTGKGEAAAEGAGAKRGRGRPKQAARAEEDAAAGDDEDQQGQQEGEEEEEEAPPAKKVWWAAQRMRCCCCCAAHAGADAHLKVLHAHDLHPVATAHMPTRTHTATTGARQGSRQGR
jgi:hypothetical protein